MSFTTRLFDQHTDIPRLVDLVNSINIDPVTVEIGRQWPARWARHKFLAIRLAVDERGFVVGYNRCFQPDFRPEGNFQFDLVVDQAYQKRGIGELLWTEVLAHAQTHHAARLLGYVRDDMPDALRFAEKRGFAVDRHIFDSVLDVSLFDDAKFASVVEAVTATGIEFTTLAEVGDSPENRQRVFELVHRTERDIPGNNHFVGTFDLLERMVYNMPLSIPDGTIIARDGDRWVGVLVLQREKEATAYNYMTGVDQAYRGRNIALALKVLSVACAHRHGIGQLFTNNDAMNAPMLAVNRKIGYQPLPGGYTLVREL